MTNLSVSVAMATFNGQAYLDRQLADLARQSALPSELVVCDDGSRDDTLLILDRFAATAPFAVRIHRNAERLGYRANFMKCAGLCRSDLIAFCDQDDRWATDKIETMLTCFTDPDVLLAFHDAEIIAEDERPLRQLASRPRPIGASRPLSGSPWESALGFTQVFRRWLCDYDRLWRSSADHQSAHEPLAHDQWYFFLASSLGTIVNVEAPLVRYRQHDSNVFGWSKVKRNWAARFLSRLRSAAWSSDLRAHDARQRAAILEQAAAALPPPMRGRAINGAIAYGRIADLCAQRAAIYAGSTVGRRFRSFVGLVRAHGYGRDSRRFGSRALALDLAVGVTGLTRAKTLQAAQIDADPAGATRSWDRPC